METTNRRIWAFFKQFAGPYKWRLIVSTTLAAIGSVADLYPAYAFAQVVDLTVKHVPGASLQPVYIILGLLFGAILVRHTIGFAARYMTINTGEKMSVDIERYSIRHVAALDMAWHEKENSGNKIQRIQNGASSIKSLSQIWSGTIVDMVVTFIGALIVLSKFNLTLVGLIIVYQILYYFISVSARSRGLKAIRNQNIEREHIHGFWFEIISNIRTVKVLGMTPKIMEYAREKTIPFLKYVRNRIFWFQLSGSTQTLWEGLVSTAFLAYIVYGISQGQYEVGFLVLFYSYFSHLTNAVAQFSRTTNELATAKTDISRLIQLQDEPIVIDIEEGKVNFPTSWETVSIKNLTFGYGDADVLSNINLEIKKGEKIGIVGLSGAGKSTLFKLLLKEHESYSGEILIGDTALGTIRKSDYVNHIAAVLQDTEVFNMSLRKNITLANSKEEDNQELFDRSLDIAHVNDFLPKLKDGAETLIGEKGVKLSGGERQRLGIARAVFKTPEILFLDEATSHLDVESEQKIQDSLKKFFRDVTAVVIAHRLSTIREMDRIIVIEGGRIIETGTFESLNAQSGRFKEFWDKQRM